LAVVVGVSGSVSEGAGRVGSAGSVDAGCAVNVAVGTDCNTGDCVAVAATGAEDGGLGVASIVGVFVGEANCEGNTVTQPLFLEVTIASPSTVEAPASIITGHTVPESVWRNTSVARTPSPEGPGGVGPHVTQPARIVCCVISGVQLTSRPVLPRNGPTDHRTRSSTAESYVTSNSKAPIGGVSWTTMSIGMSLPIGTDAEL
jgi:hypothetical protein